MTSPCFHDTRHSTWLPLCVTRQEMALNAKKGRSFPRPFLSKKNFFPATTASFYFSSIMERTNRTSPVCNTA